MEGVGAHRYQGSKRLDLNLPRRSPICLPPSTPRNPLRRVSSAPPVSPKVNSCHSSASLCKPVQQTKPSCDGKCDLRLEGNRLTFIRYATAFPQHTTVPSLRKLEQQNRGAVAPTASGKHAAQFHLNLHANAPTVYQYKLSRQA